MNARTPRSKPVEREIDEVYEDPYAPSSPGYAERHRVTRFEILPGLFREDIGG